MKHSLLSCTLVIAFSVCSNLDPVRAGDPKAGKEGNVAGLLKDLDSKNENVRVNALILLQDIGPKAAAAAPVLAKLLADKNEDVSLNAALVLGKIGKAAVPELKAPLTSDSEDVRYYALSAVGWLGPDAKALAPQVIASLKHKSETVRRKAAYALGSIAPGPKVAVPVLIKAFGDDNPDVREAATEAVAKLGAPALPFLIEALRAENVGTRQQAARALGDIGSDAKTAIDPLRVLLFDAASKAQSEAAEALGKIGKDSIPALVSGTKHDSAAVRRLAVDGLGKVGALAVPELVDALGSKFVDVRRQAAQVLAPQQINDKMVVLGLGYALKDEDEQVRMHAVQGILLLVQGAKLATPLLTDALVDGNVYVRQQAYQALRTLGSDPLPALHRGLKHKEAAVRVNAASLLVLVGYGDNDTATILSDALQGKDNTLQVQAVYAHVQQGRQVKDALPILTVGLKNKSLGVRQQVLQSFQQLNRQASAAAPEVMELLLREEGSDIRQQALHTLQAMGATSKLMLPGLSKIMKDGDTNLRNLAVQLASQHGGEGLKVLLLGLRDKDQHVQDMAAQMLYNVQGNDLSAALPETLVEMKRGDENVRGALAQLLGRMGDQAIPHLLAALRDKDSNLRWNAVNGLPGQQASAKKLVPVLVEMAEKGQDAETRRVAVHGLARLGPDAFEPLFKMLKTEKDEGLRAELIQNLGQFGGQSKELLPYLLEGAKSKSPQMRTVAAQALGNMTNHAKVVLPPLGLLIKDDDQNVRYHALYALARLGEIGQPGLLEVLKGKDDNLRIQALQYLHSIGKESRAAAVPVLIDTLKTTTNAQMRWMTCEVLANLGAEAKAAVPALTAALQDDNQTVRQRAQAALDRIQQPKKK